MPAELPLDDEHIMEDAARVKSVRTLTDLTRGTLLGSSINDVRHVLFLCIHSLQAAADPTHAFAALGLAALQVAFLTIYFGRMSRRYATIKARNDYYY